MNKEHGYDAAIEFFQTASFTTSLDWDVLVKQCLTKFISCDHAFKEGVVQCIQTEDERRTSQKRVCVKLAPPNTTCQECTHSKPGDLDAHMDMHFRCNMLESKLFNQNWMMQIPSSVSNSQQKRPLSLKTSKQLQAVLQNPELKHATRKRILTQLTQPFQKKHEKLKMLSAPCVSSYEHGSSCLKHGISHALRGWLRTADEWKNYSGLRIPYDVQRFGRLVSCLHPKEGFWQQTFPHTIVPQQWYTSLHLDSKTQDTRQPQEITCVSHELVVFTDDQYDARTCEICGEGFKTQPANDDAPSDFILTRALDAFGGTVHIHCFEVTQDSLRMKKQDKN